MIKKISIVVLSILILQLKSETYIDTNINPEYINVEVSRGKNIYNKFFIDPIKYQGFYIHSSTEINDQNYPNIPESSKKLNWSIPSITFPNPASGKMVSVQAKILGLSKFNLIQNYFNKFYYLSTAKVSDKNPHQALYLVDHYNSTVTPFIEKDTHFYPPILNKKCLYYGFADKNKKPHIYRLCSKGKKVRVFPTGLSSIEKWNISDSGEKIIGYGKVNQNTVLFTFDTITCETQILNLATESLKNFEIVIKDSNFYNYLLPKDYLCYGYIDNFKNHIHFIEFTFKNQKKLYYWDTQKNQLKLAYQYLKQKETFTPYLADQLSKNKNLLFHVHNQNNYLKVNCFNKNNFSFKSVLVSVQNTDFDYINLSCNDAGDKCFLQLILQKKGSARFYFLDFNKGTSKTIESLPFLPSLYTWLKNSFWGFGTNNDGAFKIDYSTHIVKIYPWKFTEYISFPSISWDSISDNSNINTQNFLAFTKQHEFYWYDSKTEEVKKMPFIFSSTLDKNYKPSHIVYDFLKPDLQEKLASSFFEPNKFSGHFESNPKQGIVGKMDMEKGIASILKAPSLKNISIQIYKNGRSFTDKNGFHFLEFDAEKESLFKYTIPIQKPNFVYKSKEHIIFSNVDKNNLWVWIIDFKKHMLTTLKLPKKPPLGYFDLKGDINKQTPGVLIPDQKWEEVALEEVK